MFDKFDLHTSVSSAFYDNGIKDSGDIILNLEKYKFVENEDILKELKKMFPDREIVSVDKNDFGKVSDELKSIFEPIEKRYDVKIFTKDSFTSLIISDIFNTHDLETASLSLRSPKVDILYVTPYNFNILKGVESKWNYDLIFIRILLEAIEIGSTDIHLGVKHINKIPQYTLEYRVNNTMEESKVIKINEKINKEMIPRIIQKKTNADSRDLDTVYGVVGSISDVLGDKDVSLRLSANKVFGGYKCVFRIQKMSTVSLRINELGFSKEIQDDLLHVTRKRTGLTLITGARRTGKNTTAFAMANELLDKNLSIIDYSSPIEVLMPFSQVDYMDDINYLVQCIRLSKKQDVDVVFVNEIPNSEVARAIQDLVGSSMHVITTTHINRVWHLPHKLFEFYGERYRNVLTQINICVNQKMFNKICPHCKNRALVADLEEKYRDILLPRGVRYHYINHGCSKCDNGDLRGRVQPYVERLVFDDQIVSELLFCSEPYEMERIIKEEVVRRKHTLEDQISESINNGELRVDSLDLL